MDIRVHFVTRIRVHFGMHGMRIRNWIHALKIDEHYYKIIKTFVHFLEIFSSILFLSILE